MSTLPVAAVLPELLAALQHAPLVLLNAPTGAGKSTWLPLALLEALNPTGRIILLEPRRLAARSVAQRLAEQLGQQPGETVGYRMRAESCVSAQTRIEVVTEGIMTRMLQRDPELSGIDYVLLDEFHERSVQADLALALLLEVQQGLRDTLKVIVMSATLDNERLRRLIPDAPVIISQGRSWPVERRYRSLPAQGHMEEAIAAATAQLMREEAGSLLLFLPGVREIQRVQEHLKSRIATDVVLCPLYGALSLDAQRQAILPAPEGRRKIVLATNIAETSLTIEGIRLVVDCALERSAQFDARTGLTRLVTQRISQASMTQRAGRAGRLSAGICLHLLAAEQAERASAQSEPEILRSEVSGLLMELLQWGATDITQLEWLDIPPARNVAAGQVLLARLRAIDEAGRLTALGRRMARTGVDPRCAAMLCAAQDDEARATAAQLTAIIEEPPRGGSVDLRDALARGQGSWRQRARQLYRRAGGRAEFALDEYRAAEILSWGFPDRIARRRGQDGRYRLANGSGAMLERDSAMARHEWLITPLLLQGADAADARILLAHALDIEALTATCPALLTQSDSVEWDDGKGTLKTWRDWRIGELSVKRQSLAQPSEAELHQAMLNGIRERGLQILPWSENARQLRLRLSCAARWLPELPWPAVSDDGLLATLEQWLLPHLQGVRNLQALKNLDLTSALYTLLDWPLRQRLDGALPTHYTVPTGSRIAIRYDADNDPALAVRMQEMFGEASTPVIAEGRIALVLELLSPARRPLQITRDLAAFWRGAYREVRKEMKGRYPKHVWPEDPATTAPTTRTKKYQ
ncbi:ATP-dependent helicase HrpB [Erwinia sp. HR93]|uniref:ATP-dependent helicase HrpB n=1 Tax=Erwinia sp. HR93 TaxID=3094840 RepID=UPI002ADEDA83|nr:ATP-dependent helicase HrpB [Erwinia sp. HR93]MEA1063646.1 ATP-dependent helicase HrpB [Erwinia sp. HR93]